MNTAGNFESRDNQNNHPQISTDNKQTRHAPLDYNRRKTKNTIQKNLVIFESKYTKIQNTQYNTLHSKFASAPSNFTMWPVNAIAKLTYYAISELYCVLIHSTVSYDNTMYNIIQ